MPERKLLPMPRTETESVASFRLLQRPQVPVCLQTCRKSGYRTGREVSENRQRFDVTVGEADDRLSAGGAHPAVRKRRRCLCLQVTAIRSRLSETGVQVASGHSPAPGEDVGASALRGAVSDP